ncbi:MULTISPECIES: CaiB/BaiF CoA-transferase family protein [Rhodococcus]|jgi:formyl-CoA transferase|uniref:CoA transferase n=1 Tax=Rhodococcus aetherivorans TaxID=191292 RepID=N1MEW2_9NOCA|nr:MULTISPECIES: CaiB/BaiF CoA-transferase family protein [Rhodococcus]NCL77340.1 Succinyl-CoA--L-malate CoA-transferase beta subunit [Rhodococcus sp. YH1]ANZ25957.1 formyl-CoA transferase [Rhodococcus sp. WB1]MBC2590870.1 CoA transferase [Rhodococcus aetherivorans]MDV6292455.1 CaiB/BaiF CoA-transferase family protein [Rhodococcus aetherivorans]OLL18251.1 formyl-CoA transferase [Rhodococcus sp. M8]
MNSEEILRPLEGIRVLELGNYIAAPTAGRLLADFGAEVIKVERPRTGDELRNWRLYAGDTSMLYRTVNRNKKSIVVDLRTDAGRAVILDLVRHCDVLLENFRPGTLEKWGMGPEVLSEIKPDLVITRISAFGQTGPLADRPGFAAVAEAVGGFRELVGDPDRPPVRVGVSIGDSIAGLYAAFGSVTALLQRQLIGSLPMVNRVVDVALNESMLSMMESLIPDYLAYGVRRERVGGRMEGIAPSNAYPCSDGTSVIIAGNADAIFQRYMRTIERPDLADDPGLTTNHGRWDRREELDAAIADWTRRRPRDEVLGILEAAGVPCGPIYTAADIVDDEQYRARNMIQHFAVDVGEDEPKQVGFPGIVPVLGGRSLPIRNVGPDLGEHTREILGGLLGRTEAEIDELLEVVS